MNKVFTIIMFRHGEAYHGVKNETLQSTNGFVSEKSNTSLTEKGIIQANLLADRLKDTKFDLAITSDLPEAKDTMNIVLQKNIMLKEMLPWKMVRERNFGAFEGIPQLCNAMLLVESAVADRNNLTWAPPGGESVVDVRNRAYSFLSEVHKQALKMSVASPVILVSSHGLFMEELLYVTTSVKCASKHFQPTQPIATGYQNTGIVQYTFTSNSFWPWRNDDLVSLHCPMISCARHLKHRDSNYLFCYGGCHDMISNELPSMGINPPKLMRIKRESD